MKRLSLYLLVLMTALVLASQGLVREQKPASAGGGVSVIATLSVASEARGIAVNTSTNHVYVADNGANQVSVIDGGTNTEILPRISVGAAPNDLAANPATNRI